VKCVETGAAASRLFLSSDERVCSAFGATRAPVGGGGPLPPTDRRRNARTRRRRAQHNQQQQQQ